MPLPIEIRIRNIQKNLKVSQSGIFDLPTCVALEKVLSVTITDSASLDAHRKAVQKALGFTGNDIDAVIGPGTLSRVEQIFDNTLPPIPTGANMIVSKNGLDIIIESEVTSQAVYNKKYKFPTWPGGDSGITIGIGYDLGYYNSAKIITDWGNFISGNDMNVLLSVVGLKGNTARLALNASVKAILVPWNAALEVFYTRSVPAYAKQTKSVYPGVERLPPDAQAALLSLIYNRGTSLAGNRRTEMKNIAALVPAKNLKKIASQIRGMKRLWDASQSGLWLRREKEAGLVENATYTMSPNEYVYA